MKIHVLGPGCAKCKVLAQHVNDAVSDLGLPAEVVKVDAIEEIMQFGVMSTPALVIDGKVAFSGRTGSVDEIKKILASVK